VRARFEPPTGSLAVAQGAFHRFGARSADGVLLRAEYRVDGEVRYRGTAYLWLAETLGSHRIEAEVDFGTHTSTGIWSVDVRHVDPDLVPVVTEIEAEPGEFYGTLELNWQRPSVPELHVPIMRYQIYYAQSPFADITDPKLVRREIADDASQLEQHLLLTELDPQRDCYSQWVSVNQFGRRSAPSHLVVARPRGSGSIDLPPPRELRIETPNVDAALQVSWQPPDLESGVIVARYEIYWSTFAFAPEQLASVSVRSVAAVPGPMSVRIDGLSSDVLYHFRVRAIDGAARVSALTPLASGRTRISPIEFTLSGRVREIDREAWQLSPLSGVTLRAEVDSTISGADGNWLLPTRTQGELHLVAHTKGAHYPARLEILGSENRSFDFLLLKVGLVQIDSDTPALSGPMSQMEFLHRMTGTTYGTTSNPGTIHRWSEYPVQIQRPTLILVRDGELIDYGASFERAVTAWNLATGAELLRLVQERPAIGVYVEVDLAPGSGLLGNTEFVQPPSVWFTAAVPELLRIRLREFNSQALADRVALHELGHCLGLLHSPSLNHVLHLSAPALPVHADEANLARLLSILPQATPLSWYAESP
jgi:hypothetical protein